MTRHSVVVPNPDDTNTRGTVTVEGNKLPPVLPADNISSGVINPSRPAVALPTNASIYAGKNKQFMEQAVVWPGSANAPGWINLHCHRKNSDPAKNGGKDFVVGWAFKTVDDFLSRARQLESTSSFYDVWFCTSQQRERGTNPKGTPTAIRKAQNATCLKAIWIDIDVKPDDTTGRYYTSKLKALAAIRKFRKKMGLPTPSAVIKSGAGLHVYWISDEPLPLAAWRPYAEGLRALLIREGLKCDIGVTADAVRLLRVPGTLNHKYNPPKKVKLLHLGSTYDFPSALAVLLALTPTNSIAKAPSPFSLVAPIEPGHEWEFQNGPDPAFASLAGADNLATGILRRISAPLDPVPVFEKCGFMRHGRDTGGADYDNSLWMYSVLCATFLENGNAIAHDISKGHVGYTHAETQAMYERKLADHTERGIGWPGCATIHGAGCKSCASCPFFAQGKSPLHLTCPVTATVNPLGSAQQTSLWSSTAMNVVFANVPHRRTLYGHDLVRGEITVLGSPGGAGKSSLAIGIGISIAVGREILGETIYGTNLRVVIINAEDSTAEMRRRVLAFCRAHQVLEPELLRLHVAGTDQAGVQAISLLRTNPKNVSELDSSGLAAFQSLLRDLRPDLVVLDPLVALCSNGNINDNSSMSLVIRALKRLAIEFDCAILIVHHTRKGGDAGSAEAISGASSIVNLARRVIMPVTLTATEALKLNIVSEHWRYFKVVDAKTNLAPRGIDPPLYRLQSVGLQNAEPPTYPHGDNVQAVVRVQLPIQGGGTGASDSQKIRRAIIKLIHDGKEIDGTSYPYSPTSAGADNFRALLPDAIAAARAAIAPQQRSSADLAVVVKAIIKDLRKEKVLVSRPIEELLSNPGPFRRVKGLKVDHSRISNGESNAAELDAAA